jgi:hypothetical protein
MPKKKSVKGVKQSERKKIKDRVRKEQESIKYATVRNITGNAKLAQKVRGWSYDRILLELDIVIPERKPRLKPLPKEKKLKMRNLQEAKFQYAIKRGLDQEQANFLRTKTYKQIEKDLYYKKMFTEKSIKVKSQDYFDRYDQWKELSREDELPPELVRQARLVNLKKGLDINERFGFAVLFYQWTRGKTIDHWAKELDWDKVNELVIYQSVQKR